MKDEALVEAITRDYTSAPISAADRALLDYATKLTRAPWTMTEQDIAALRDAGFSDSAIFDLNQVVSYFAFVNRIADGLGVQLEARWGEKA